ncbi:uncharacterized protein LOC143266293 [Megachile rotundata]|uniref:uncharacterized protein LOC143266293 n=1 Tax=Megachile rotundata TaxID=143995 RepID=UPI003FD2617F
MKLKKGLPQGSVLSPLLYNLYTVGIFEGLREAGVKILQYADDIVIFVEFEKRNEAMEKTQIVKFISSKKGGGLAKEEFMVNNGRVEEVDSAKFLGMWIDRGLDFKKHTEGIRKGTGPKTVLKVFVAVIRSVIEYGAPIYLNNKRNREKVQRVHNAGVSGIMDLETRVRVLMEWYIARKFWSRNREVVGAIEDRIRNSDEEEISEGKDMIVDAWRRFGEIEVGMSRKETIEYNGEWRVYRMESCLEWKCGKHFETVGMREKDLLGEIKLKMFGRIENVVEIYTDGSRIESRKNGGGAVVIREGGEEWEEETFTSPSQCSVYTIEMTAIGRAVEIAGRRFRGRDVVILSDSLSTISELAKDNRGQDRGDAVDNIKNRIKKRNCELKKRGNDRGKIVLAWIPAHVGIEGNERADRAAKEATIGDADVWVKFTLKDYKRVVKERGWVESTETHLRQGEYKGRRYFEARWNNVGKDFPWFRGIGELSRESDRSALGKADHRVMRIDAPSSLDPGSSLRIIPRPMVEESTPV